VWLAATFVLTTIGADLAHTHGPASVDPTHCDPSCGDASLHVSGHRSVELSDLHADCLACLHRGLVYDLPTHTLAQVIAVEASAFVISPTPPPRQPEGRPLGRAPPRA
jgi:hypothetical protein